MKSLKFNNEKEVPSSYKCNGTGIIISTTFSLPIPLSSSYSTITYEFFTEGGDINFSIFFIPSSPHENNKEGEEEIIFQNNRVNSDSENIFGSYQIDCPGTIIFSWDNSYSWFNNKILTYAIEIQQDEIESAKRPRVIDSRRTISLLSGHKSQIQIKSNSLSEEMTTLSTEITELEETIWKLKQQLQYKKRVFQSVTIQKKDFSLVMEECHKLTPALCIRTLSNYELACVLQYLEIATVKLVCKYWYDICTCEFVEGREAPETDYLPIPSLYTLPALPSHRDLVYSFRPSGHDSLPQEIIISSSTRNKSTIKQEDKQKDGKQNGEENNGIITKEGGNVGDRGVVELKDNEEISSLSDDNHIGKSSVVMKKRSEIEKYLEEILSRRNELEVNEEMKGNVKRNENEENIINGMNLLHLIEKEKLEVKGKIIQWKKHFEKKYHRQPSDEEKVKNIPGLFQKYSVLNRRLAKEQQRLTELMSEEKKRSHHEEIEEDRNDGDGDITTTADVGIEISRTEDNNIQELESPSQIQQIQHLQSQSQGENENHLEESDETSED